MLAVAAVGAGRVVRGRVRVPLALAGDATPPQPASQTTLRSAGAATLAGATTTAPLHGRASSAPRHCPAMLQPLGDPYTRYLLAGRLYASCEDAESGTYAGVGLGAAARARAGCS